MCYVSSVINSAKSEGQRAAPVLDPQKLEGIQAMIDALPFYAMLVTPEHMILAANLATREALGLGPEELICKHCPQVVHGVDEVFEGCPLEQAVATGQHVEREMYEQEQGRWFLSSVSPTDLRTDDDQQVYLHFTRDITSAKQGADDLSRSLEQHRALTEILRQVQTCHTPAQLLEVVLDRVLELSWMELADSAAAFLAEGDQLSLAVRRNLDPEVARRCASVPLGRCVCGQAAAEERTIVSSSSCPEHVDWQPGLPEHGHVTLPLIHSGTLHGVLNFYLAPRQELPRERIDFLEIVASLSAVALGRLQAQAHLTQTDRVASMGLLASVVAHEIRTPLNALSINVQRIARKLRREQQLDRDEMTGLIAGLQGEVEKINHQIEDHLLAMVRHQPAELAPVRVNDLLLEAARFLDPEATYSGISITNRLAERLPPALADPNKLRRVLLNLILNAIQAQPDGGQVQLTTALADDQVIISVQDDGPGITEAQGVNLESVCQPLVTTKQDGTGLGLAICVRLIKELQGRIMVTAAPGEGSRFDVILTPTAAAAEPA